MKTNRLVMDLLQNQNDRSNPAEILVKILGFSAREKDSEINRKLMKTLLLKYSDSEKKLVELNNLKNKFLGIAAHDLRNPLSSILGLTEMLLDESMGPLNDEQKEFIAMMYSASEQMLALLNDLLDISAIESGKLDIRQIEGSLYNLVKERISLTQIIADKKDIKINMVLQEVPEFEFDAARVSQVIDNLISNAVKFSQPESAIHVLLETAGNVARVSVRDEGPGISPEDQKNMFGEFQKLNAKPTAGEKSTGLGLSIAKKIILAHGGIIDVENAPEKGALFWFTLPMKGNTA